MLRSMQTSLIFRRRWTAWTDWVFCGATDHLEIFSEQKANDLQPQYNRSLYNAEPWKVTQFISHKLDIFNSKCLRRILKIFWPNTISNTQLHHRTEQLPFLQKWRADDGDGLANVLAMDGSAIPSHSCYVKDTNWTEETWRSVQKERRAEKWSRGQVQTWARERVHWRTS